MNIMLLPPALPVPLVQPPAGQRCAGYRWRHHERTRDIPRTAFIAAYVVIGNSLGIPFTTRVGIRATLTQFESP